MCERDLRPTMKLTASLAQVMAACASALYIENQSMQAAMTATEFMNHLFMANFSEAYTLTCTCIILLLPHSRAPKKNTSHGNEVIPQFATHLIQRLCYQRGSPCQDQAGNRTTLRFPDHRKEAQTAVVRSCLPFIRSGRNHLCKAQ